MSYPGPWQFAILALAVVYGFYLVSESVILERPRDWILTRLDDDKWEVFIECPWCVGFWLSLAVYGAWSAFPDATLAVCAPFAIAAANGLVSRLTDST